MFDRSPPPVPSATEAAAAGLPFDPDYYHDYHDHDDDDDESRGLDDIVVAANDNWCFRCYCKIHPRCGQFVRSVLAIILATTCIASSIVVCLGWSSGHDDVPSSEIDPHLGRDVAALSMATMSLLISFFVIWNEISFLLRVDVSSSARRRSLVGLNHMRRLLAKENTRLTNIVDDLETRVGRYDSTISKLRNIVETQSVDVDDAMRIVNDNEDVVESIRENIRLGVMMDVVDIIIANDDIHRDDRHRRGFEPRGIIDAVRANILIDEIKARIYARRGVVLDEINLMHAIASDSTTWGLLRAVVRSLLPDGPSIAEGDDDVRVGLSGGIIGTEVVDDIDDDAYDALFLLSNDDTRQAGSVDVARAILAGKEHTPLTTSTTGRRRRRRGESSGLRSRHHRHRRLSPAAIGDDDANEDDDVSVVAPPCACGKSSPEKTPVYGTGTTLRGQLRQFWNMSIPYFREDVGGRVLFGFMFVLCLCYSAISVYFSYLFRDFYTALADKEVHKFYDVLYRFLISLIFLIPLQVRRIPHPTLFCVEPSACCVSIFLFAFDVAC